MRLIERREDIAMLAEHFLRRAASATGGSPRALGQDAIAVLQTYDWPGNVRQLRNMIEWLLIMAPGSPRDEIRADMLPPEISAVAPSVVKWDRGAEMMSLPLRDAREVFEREYLLAQVTRFGCTAS